MVGAIISSSSCCKKVWKVCKSSTKSNRIASVDWPPSIAAPAPPSRRRGNLALERHTSPPPRHYISSPSHAAKSMTKKHWIQYCIHHLIHQKQLVAIRRWIVKPRVATRKGRSGLDVPHQASGRQDEPPAEPTPPTSSDLPSLAPRPKVRPAPRNSPQNPTLGPRYYVLRIPLKSSLPSLFRICFRRQPRMCQSGPSKAEDIWSPTAPSARDPSDISTLQGLYYSYLQGTSSLIDHDGRGARAVNLSEANHRTISAASDWAVKACLATDLT